MTGLRKAALVAITLLVAAASLTSFAESYRALFLWASHHGLQGVWAYAWPLQIDVFIAVGEMALLVALADSWPVRSRAAAWSVTMLGLGVSVAGNIGHIAGHDIASRATAAVPPLAAAAALAVGLGVLKRVVGGHGTVPADPTAELMDLVSQVAAGAAALAAELRTPLAVPEPAPESAPAPRPSAPAKRTRVRPRSAPGKRIRTSPVTVRDAEAEFMSELASGAVPSQRQIRDRLRVGQDRARELRSHLESVSART